MNNGGSRPPLFGYSIKALSKEFDLCSAGYRVIHLFNAYVHSGS